MFSSTELPLQSSQFSLLSSHFARSFAITRVSAHCVTSLEATLYQASFPSVTILTPFPNTMGTVRIGGSNAHQMGNVVPKSTWPELSFFLVLAVAQWQQLVLLRLDCLLASPSGHGLSVCLDRAESVCAVFSSRARVLWHKVSGRVCVRVSVG